MMGGGAMGPPIMFRMMFALMEADSDGTISLQGFRRLTKEFSRQWTATKMASLPWRRCKRSCTGPGDRFRGSQTSELVLWHEAAEPGCPPSDRFRAQSGSRTKKPFR